jgi:predicted metal-dependent HD superfamily phosphohydrolase
MNPSLLEKAETSVVALFRRKAGESLTFHNLQHTRTVVRAVEEIAAMMEITPKGKEILLLAAWFHDCGYLFQYSDHEEKSKKLAKAFLTKEHYPTTWTNKVMDCIEATKPAHQPAKLLEQILCDADMRHLASENYLSRLDDLRKEWASFLGQTYSDEHWIRLNLDFLAEHHYYTSYGREMWEAPKRENTQRLEQMLD